MKQDLLYLRHTNGTACLSRNKVLQVFSAMKQPDQLFLCIQLAEQVETLFSTLWVHLTLLFSSGIIANCGSGKCLSRCIKKAEQKGEIMKESIMPWRGQWENLLTQRAHKTLNHKIITVILRKWGHYWLILDQTWFWLAFNASIKMMCRHNLKCYFNLFIYLFKLYNFRKCFQYL